MAIAQASVSNSTTTVLTVASGQNYLVRSIICANYHASSAETLTLYVIPNGGSAGNSTTILKSRSLAAGEVLTLTEELLLDAGDKVAAVGTTGSLVAVTVSYRSLE